MIKEYELLMFEWNIQSLSNRLLKETSEEMGSFSKGGLVGAGVGAVAGAGSALMKYMKQRKAIQQKMSQCRDPQCTQQAQQELRQLNTGAIKSGLGRTIGGAALGGAAGAAIGTGAQMYKGSQVAPTAPHLSYDDPIAASDARQMPTVSAAQWGMSGYGYGRGALPETIAKAEGLYKMGSPQAAAEIESYKKRWPYPRAGEL